MHKRRKILEDLQTQLKTVAGFAGVWIQRGAPSRNAFPGITLYADSETVEYLLIHQPNTLDRTLNVSIVAWIKGSPNDEKIEADMDKAAAAIETELVLPADALTIQLVSTDFNLLDDEAGPQTITINYSITYETIENLPE